MHINPTITEAKLRLNILKAFTCTKWDKQKELIISIFKANTCPTVEYAKNVQPFCLMGQIINISTFNELQNYMYMKFTLFGIRCHDQITSIKI